MSKHYLLFFAVLFTSSFSYAQVVVRGRVFENKSHISLEDIHVQNQTTNQSVTTDEKGRFSVAAKIGDILIFRGFSYLPDTVLLTDMKNKEVFLTPKQNLLDEVKVKTDSTKNMNTYYDPEFHGQTIVYQRDRDMNYSGGIAIRLWYWKKDQHKKERLAKEIKEAQDQDEVAKVFSSKNIAKYVPLKGKDLDDFLVLYMPTTKDYFKADFNLNAYVNDCYKKYQKLPDGKRHPAKLTD